MTMRKDGQLYSELWLDTSYYQIRDLGDGISAFVEIDNSTFVDGCAVVSDTPFSEREQVAEVRDDPQLCPVRVLILFTEAALDAHPDIQALANAGIASTKISLARSNVTENQLSISLAGIHPLSTSEWSESGNIDIDRYSLNNNSHITGYRAQFNADLVFVLTASVYGDFRGAVTAFGDALTDKDSAFAIVDANEINAPNYTFAHEFGHLFGARHEGRDLCASDGDDSGLEDAHGYRFHKLCNCLIVQRKDYHTLMSTNCGNKASTRIQNYSNPDVEYKNKKTGRVGLNNNAQILRNASCRVSNYLVSDDVSVNIIGNQFGCPFTAIGLQAIFSVDEPFNAYIFKWESSFDGNTWFDIQEGTGLSNTFYTVEVPEIPYQLYIRLSLTTPSGLVIYAWHTITPKEDEDCPHHPHRPVNNRDATLGQNSILVFPNPNNGKMELLMTETNGNNVGFSIFNQLGQQVYVRPSLFSENDLFQTSIDTPNLPEGAYWMKVQNGTKVSFEKILIAKE